MPIKQDLLEKLRSMPEEQQQAVSDFVDSLKEKNGANPRRSLRGLWKAFNVDLTEQDISNARHEMWGKFPRNVS